MLYWYNGQSYYYCQIEELEKLHGWNISGLYPQFTQMQKITILNGVQALSNYYGVKNYHLEFHPTNEKKFVWVSDDANNRGAMNIALS